MGWRDWTGVGERRWKTTPGEEVQPAKTLWDWLQLLIVPAILIGVTLVWSYSQARSDNKREDRRIAADRAAAEEVRQDATLDGYLTQMSGLMLHEKLLTSKEGDTVRVVARTVTLATLRRLEADRKGEVVKFLVEAQLLDAKKPLLRLEGADLSGAALVGADLEDVTFAWVNLERANLSNAHLAGSNLEAADLEGADLEDADLAGANLFLANLEGANLDHAYFAQANLSEARLSHAILAGANLQGASLQSAHLNGADLSGANLREAFLDHAEFVGADLRNADLRQVSFLYADLDGADLKGAVIAGTDFETAENLDLSRLIADLPRKEQKAFLNAHRTFLSSLSPDELAMFNLSPEKLAKLRIEASGA